MRAITTNSTTSYQAELSNKSGVGGVQREIVRNIAQLETMASLVREHVPYTPDHQWIVGLKTRTQNCFGGWFWKISIQYHNFKSPEHGNSDYLGCILNPNILK